MPNWCYNEMIITGEKTEIDRFVKEIRGKNFINKPIPLSFDKITPMPENFKKTEEWYDWAVANWGTKWDLTGDEISTSRINSTMFIMSFDTAWSPPEPIFEKLAKMFPKLTFEINFNEAGVGFQGTRSYQEGKCVGSTDGEYTEEDEEEEEANNAVDEDPPQPDLPDNYK